MPDDHSLFALIRARSLTLGERLTLPEEARVPLPNDEDIALAPWVRVYSPGNPEALLRRLSWDGITPSTAAHAMAEPSSRDSDLPTDDWFGRDLAEFAAASRSATRRTADPDDGIPFAPVWIPFVDLARARLEESFRPSSLLENEALDDLVRHLTNQLSWWGSPTLLQRFAAARASGLATFERFCEEILLHPLRFWSDHAALLRRLLLLTRQWGESTSELLSRIQHDREAIRDTFGCDAGRVARVRPGLSDRHHGGRQVAILELAGGERLVYKPRECRSLLRFNDLLCWFGPHGGSDAPRPIRVLDRGDYGWVEFVDHATLASREEVALYFRRAGALLCFAWLSGGHDLHMDNVICSSGGPVIVDTEAFVPPRWSEDTGSHPGAMQLARNRVSTSVVGTGMLSFPQEDARGRVYDIGGLCGEGGYVSPAPVRTWKEINTDRMHVAEETPFVAAMQNVVRHEGKVERPEQWVDEIVSGFGSAFETLLARRDELVSDDGPLSRFRDARCRIIFRPSNQYATLLQTMTSPVCSRSGLTGSLYIESLARVFSREETIPELWPLVREERESLESLDIPLFAVDCASTTIDTRDGRRLEGLIATSGVDALRERISNLRRDALDEQTRLIRASLLSSAGHSDHGPQGELPVTRNLPADPQLFVDEAAAIGRALLDAAIRGNDGAVTWIAPEYLKITSIADLGATYYLYSGITGPSIFLAALGRVTRDSRVRETARNAWTTLERLVESGDAKPVRQHLRLGICNGIGSITYAAVLASGLLGDPTLLDVGRGFAELIDAERLENETDFDIEGGIAGAVLALVRLHEATSEASWLELAARGVERLVALARSDEAGSWWVLDESAPPLAGMAHGASGVAMALEAFARASGRDDILPLAREAFRWEETVFDTSLGNWPVRTSDGRKIDMVAWCHGAGGIGLARIAAASVASSTREDLERAVRAVTATGLHPVDHVCCGNSGRIDFLLEASQFLEVPDLLVEARARCAAMIDRAGADRAYTLTTESSEKDLIRPGFFRGLSGIGYTLLRAADPRSLPSIARFDRPGRDRDA